MRCGEGRFPQIWNPYRFDAATCAAAATQLSEMARLLGFELDPTIVTIAGLKHSDGLRIGHEGVAAHGAILEYPFEDRGGPESPAVLRPRMIEELLRHLHDQRWRWMRRQAMQGVTGAELDAHYDCTALGRWASALASSGRGLTSSHREERVDDFWMRVKVASDVSTAAGRLHVTHDALTLPMRLPDTLEGGIAGRRLREILTLPSCGDAELDREVLEEGIYQVEEDRTGLQPRTRIRLYATLHKPMNPAGAEQPWRRLRAIRVDCTREAPDYQRIDIARAAAEYHALCDDALGQERAGPIPYPPPPEPLRQAA